MPLESDGKARKSLFLNGVSGVLLVLTVWPRLTWQYNDAAAEPHSSTLYLLYGSRTTSILTGTRTRNALAPTRA
jgi:hypothetical protein